MLSSLLLDLEQSHGRVTDTTHIANLCHYRYGLTRFVNFNSTMTAVFSRTFREKFPRGPATTGTYHIPFQAQCLTSSRRVAR
ncbi:hypothetical protein JB92DRAFT_2888320 [Gautieria morchelliformis]|nr:hypothetical protein JB92DRAFT_2888320 [Gautieria morchelliformis]